MASPKQVPEPWRSFLRELDQQATEETRLDCRKGRPPANNHYAGHGPAAVKLFWDLWSKNK
jgi:hypothetical protein